MAGYKETHPWLTFQATDFNKLSPKAWMLLGEARSKCEHLAGAALKPQLALALNTVAMVKGAHATTAIEGNTLTNEEVQGILDGSFKAPPSREYQEREVRNVLDALNDIDNQLLQGATLSITTDLILDFHKRLLDGTEYDDHVVPGEYRTTSVAVSKYVGPPAQDVPGLMEQLADWLEGPTFKSEDKEIQFALTVAQAVYAHLYIAWIHPFGDGNGRSARLLEFLILARCGQIPLIASHLLANHYNLTRDRYYRELAKASEAQETSGLIEYALQGFVDGLRGQIESVRQHQLDVAWTNFVHETMSQFPTGKTRDRQRALVLAMPRDTHMSRKDLVEVSPEVAGLYAVAGERTLSRDLNRLRQVGLIIRQGRSWMANYRIIEAFIPPMAKNGPESAG